MIDKTIEELMWLEIDASISADDHNRLWSHLNAHPEDRDHFEQLKDLDALFGAARDMDPPPELRPRILRSLQTASPEWMQTTADTSFWTRFREIVLPRPAWRVAAAVVAGIFIGVIGYHLFSYRSDALGPLDTSQFSGTMGLRSVDGRGPVVEIAIPDAHGTFAAERVNSRVRSWLDITSESEIDVVIDYAGRTLRYGGGDLAERSSNQITVEDHGIRVRNRGEGNYFFEFQLHDDATSPLVVRILEEGNVLLEQTVQPEQTSKKE